MILFLLLFLGSGFVRTATMPTGLRQFAEYQPFTPVVDTVRGLLTDGRDRRPRHRRHRVERRHRRRLAYLWAIRLYNRRRAAEPN